jgi:diguanylate cyclase (GGDEF)-like protein
METGIDDLVRLAERIRARIESAAHCKAPRIRITISIGAASLQDDDTPETLLKRADDALYQAKKEGRNRTVLL